MVFLGQQIAALIEMRWVATEESMRQEYLDWLDQLQAELSELQSVVEPTMTVLASVDERNRIHDGPNPIAPQLPPIPSNDHRPVTLALTALADELTRAATLMDTESKQRILSLSVPLLFAAGDLATAVERGDAEAAHRATISARAVAHSVWQLVIVGKPAISDALIRLRSELAQPPTAGQFPNETGGVLALQSATVTSYLRAEGARGCGNHAVEVLDLLGWPTDEPERFNILADCERIRDESVALLQEYFAARAAQENVPDGGSPGPGPPVTETLDAHGQGCEDAEADPEVVGRHRSQHTPDARTRHQAVRDAAGRPARKRRRTDSRG
jgi:hypothetical protein